MIFRRLMVSALIMVLTVGATPAPQRPAPQPGDIGTMSASIDGMIGAQLAENHIAGATVAVVENGRVIFARGYGYADADKRIPVVADRTLFRIGSISKLFTTIATMQLAEAGKVSLDADVSRYLDFTIPRVSKAPLTLAHLMTHTAGFAESLEGLLVKSPSEVLPVGQLVKRTLPPLVRAPGTAPSYSNHGIALEGYIIERVSGLPYDDYMDRYVLGPLGMRHSSFREPLPAALASEVSHGHSYDDGRLVPQPFELTNIAPAGSISATATDMARFMIANLQQGEIDGVQVMKPETARAMQACHYRTDPRAECMAYGFYHQKMAGHEVIAHDGGTNLFLSNLVLLPEHQFGVFVSYNSPGGGKILDDLPRMLIAERFGTIASPAATATNFGDDMTDYAGSYRSTRRIQRGWLSILGLATSDVEAAGPQHLKFGERTWREVGPGWFRDDSPTPSDDTLIFRRGADGKVDSLYLGNLPPLKMERVPGYTTQGVALTIIGLFALAAALFAIWAIATRRQWWPSRTRAVVAGISFGIVSVVAGGVTLVILAAGLESAGFGPPPAARAMIALFDIGMIAFLLAAALLVRGWRGLAAGWRGRGVMLAVLATAAPLGIFLTAWDLVGLAR